MALRNPLLAGFHPDPSATRVGDLHVLVTSTFEHLPGLPVHVSADAETWELVGHVVDRTGQLAVETVPTLGGAWAPTVRHRDGTWYVVVTDAMGRGTLVFTAQRPEGPWSDGTALAGLDGIDPDLAWDDDGTCYVTYSALGLSGESLGRHRGIEQVRVDLATGALLEEPRPLWSGTGLQFPEAPHLYSIGDWWYLLIAEGGTERGHAVSVARSTRPDGGFEGCPANPVLSARSTDRPVQNTGHGDLLQLADGSWVMVCLGMRPRGMTRAFSPMGRETFVTRVRWEDGWPVVDPVELDDPPGGEVVVEDDFTGDALGPEWIGVRRLPAAVSSLTARPGSLVLTADGSTLDDPSPVFVGRRQTHHDQRWSVTCDPGADGCGGLALRLDEDHHHEVEVSAGPTGSVVTARARLAGVVQEWSAPVPAGPVTLVVECDPVGPGGRLPLAGCDLVRLALLDDGELVVLAEVDGRYLSAETAASFTGRVLGLHASRGEVAFTGFRSVARPSR